MSGLRTVDFRVRLSPAERAALEGMAQASGMSASSVLRSLLHADSRFRHVLFAQARETRHA